MDPRIEPQLDPVIERRQRMRALARGLREADVLAAPPRYETPAWLDRSFVLPLTSPDLTDVPHQSTPHHDDAAPPEAADQVPSPSQAPAFERPPTREIDYARVIKRSDLRRTTTRAAVAATGVAGLVLIAYLLTMQPLVLGMAIAFGLVAVVAGAASVRLTFAPVPYL
jgi:hypothetical protein